MRNMKFLMVAFLAIMLTGCQLLPENAQLRSYRVLVQQGNIIDENKVDALKINMTKEQVVFLLGEPVVNNIFDKNRWDYVYYRKRDPEETQLNMVSIFFEEDNVISMKRIIKNDDGLFEINNKSQDFPEFTNENKITSIDNNIFSDIELQSSERDGSTNFQDEEANKLDIPEEELKNTISRESMDKENTILNENLSTEKNPKNDNYKEIFNEDYPVYKNRKNDYEIVKLIIMDWVKSWENKDIDSYFSFYLENYSSDYFDSHELWKKDRYERIMKKSSINIDITNLEIIFDINEDEIAQVTFDQIYKSNNYSDNINKMIKLIKKKGYWKIFREEIIEKNY